MALFKKEVDELDSSVQGKYESNIIGKLLGSKFFIPAVAVVALLVLLVVFANVMKGSTPDVNYYDMMQSLFTNELGTFSYTVSVETGPKGTVIDPGVVISEEIEAGDPESGDDDPEITGLPEGFSYETSDLGRAFVDWSKYANVKIDTWKNPVYTVQIAGTTMSLDPLMVNFSVYIATPYCNDKFMEVTVRDEMYYIDVETMYRWLMNSGDSHLIDLASEVPRGSKVLEIPAVDFVLPSRYAEEDEEELSSAHSLVTVYRRFLTSMRVVVSSLSSSMGNRGVDARDGSVYISYVADDAVEFAKAVRNIVTRSGDVYDAIISAAYSSSLYSEDQYYQALREKDNFIKSMESMVVAAQICDPNTLNLQVAGQVRQYENGYRNQQIEGSFGAQFSTETEDYIIKFVGIRSGDMADIVVPSGSKTQENAPLYRAAMLKVADYLNFTPIELTKRLVVDSDTLSDYVLDNFIKLVNDKGTAGYYLTRDNVGEFIEKYWKFNPIVAESEADLVNAQLVADYLTIPDKVVPVELIEEPLDDGNDNETQQTDVPEVEQYPDIEWEYNGALFRFHRNETASQYGLFIVDCEVINKSESEMSISCENFWMQDLLASTYLANNEILIRGYDSTFDMSLLDKDFTVGPSMWKEFRLFFIGVDHKGHMDLFYGDTKVDAIIQY